MERLLYVDVHGLTTRRLHHEGATFELAIDFRDDALVVRSGDGRRESLSLVGGVPVAIFDAEVHRLLRDLGVDVEILEEPFGVPMTTPFPEDTEHAAWDHDAVGRFGHILDWSDTVLGGVQRLVPRQDEPGACTSFGTGSISPSRGSPDGRAAMRATTA